MLAFLRHRWFLLLLVAVLIAGISWPAAVRPFVDWLSSDAILATVTFMMALPLRTATLWHAVRKPGPAWLASLLSSGLAPPMGWLASRTLPTELAAGVILATTVPSTLASAAVITRRAGGNNAVALLVTVITNLACFLVVPTWLLLLIGLRANVDFSAIVLNLALWVVLPIVVAQLVRQLPAVGEAATRYHTPLSVVAQVGVLLMVLIGAVQCGERLLAMESNSILTPFNLFMLVAVVIVVHVVLVTCGFVLSRVFAIVKTDAIAVAFSGSQKTLMVGVYLATAVGPLAILPMVAYHAAQLVIDTLIADWLRQRDAKAGRELDSSRESPGHNALR